MESKIILAKNIKMDKNYTNVLDYSEEEMLQLVNNNLVASADDYTFIDNTKGYILAGFTYRQVMQANYVAFQNPNYANKWYFAFIDDIKYIDDGNVQINFSVDVWSTWFSYWTTNSCYVLREHVNDDVAGNYTQPEGLELGEYVCNNIVETTEMNTLVAIVQVTKSTTGEDILATNYGGVWSAGGAYVCENITQLVNLIQSYGEGKADAIIQVYLVPKCFVENDESGRYEGQATPLYLQKVINKPDNINGYVPKNKKLLTFPYCYLNVSNNNGTTNSYAYELFNKDDAITDNQVSFNIKGVPVVGGSIKCCPYQYKCGQENNNEDEGIMAGKYPTLSWSEDSYTNWLTQNAVNLSLGLASNLVSIVGGIASANPVGAVGGIITGSMGIASQIGQVYEHSLVPYTAKGNTNGGDINVSSDSQGFYFYQMSIRQEYAKIIDDYFTRYGYKINRIKIPNLSGRTYYNYIEIGSSEEIGQPSSSTAIPAVAMEEINNIARKGTTIWHNHNNLGDFSLNNTIN